ncbi:MAG: fructose-bisphosphate aldolase, partial [Candidatus Bathyarchaeia archaeon]
TALVATTEYAEESLIEAMKFDACAVKTTYFGDVPPEEAIRERFRHIALKCNEWGMPYMAECVPAKPSGEYIFDADLIQKAARVSAELGADIVKTAYPGTMDGFKKAIEACPAPIVIAGGPRIESDRDALKMVKESVEAGGAGVAIGRNIWQHKHPSKMTEAIAKIIHEDISVEEALKILK